MKAVLISTQPKWVDKITSGEKTVEVRKTRPKSDTPFKVYIYCAKGKDLLREVTCWNTRTGIHKTNYKIINLDYCTNKIANGKVIGEFVCDRIDEFDCDRVFMEYCVKGYIGAYLPIREMCLTKKQLIEYGKGKTLYGWHISDLKIYDKPKELSEFNNLKRQPIQRAFQSWGYVEVEE